MQATSVSPRRHTQPGTILLGLGVVTAVALFLLVIGRFGVLGSVLPAGPAMPPADIVLTAEQMRFGQDELRLQVGQTVAVVLDNRDLYGHSFDVDGLGVHIAMPAKQEVIATFTATRPGIFEFYCGVPGHTEAGMIGKIIVEP